MDASLRNAATPATVTFTRKSPLITFSRYHLVTGLISLWAAGSAIAGDWAAWRGPDNHGATRDKAVVTSWDQSGDNVIWHQSLGGRSVPIVLGDRVYFNGPVGEGVGLQERVVCLDRATGKQLWEQRFNVYHTDIVENRVGWTALAADAETGYVYCHSTGGDLLCFDRDGKPVWKQALTEDFGRFSGYGGRIFTPVIDQNRVIIAFVSSSWGDQAPMGMRYFCFDKRDGRVLWSAQPGAQPKDTTYATPVVADIDGRRILVAPNADGWVYAMEVDTGRSVWKFHASERPLNTSPVVSGNLVYVTHSEENYDTTVMGRVMCFEATGSGDITKQEKWRADGIAAGYATPSLANGRLYVVDNSANLYALDAATGQQKWTFSLGRIARGSTVATADGVIYVGEQNGVFWILKDEGDKCAVLDQDQFPPRNEALNEIQGTPAVVDGQVFMMSRYDFYCLGVKDAKVETVNPPDLAKVPPAATQPALLVTPAEATLKPGEQLPLTWSVFAPSGGGPAGGEPAFEVKGAKGALGPEGFTAATDNAFSAGTITAKLGDLSSTTRVRICPAPPFTEDFEKYAVDGNPPGWLNVNGKTRIVERDGGKVLMQLSERPTPAMMRIRTYMTPPIAGGYTIEADMLGTPKKPLWKPDMGVVNSRYELLLLGSEPTLRLVTWAPIPRLQKDVAFEWQTDTWYRMKLEVRIADGKALLRGKVWPRGESEPSAWNIEAEDPFPNTEGSPALYGYAAGTTAKSKGTQVFWDNVVVRPND